VEYGLKHAWKIVQVVPEFPSVRVLFADGTTHRFDLSSLFERGPLFHPLRDRAFFDRVGVVNGALTWPNEADISPDTLYAQATGRSGW
jgi:hypothetical protein